MSNTAGHDRVAWMAARVPWTARQAVGVPLDHPSARLQPESVVTAMAAVTRVVHGLDAAHCPFSASVDELLERAGRRVAEGIVQRSAFAAPYQRYGEIELLELCVSMRPVNADARSDLVVTHGGLTPAGVTVDGGSVTAVAGGETLGVGDRYRDLAVTAAALAEVIGPGAVGPFLAEYGIERPDPLKIDFFVLVSQFG